MDPDDDDLYPSSDGRPMAESDVHREVMCDLIHSLKTRYAQRDDVYVSGNLFVYYAEGKPEPRLAPDCFVVCGVPPGDRDNFKVWTEGVLPRVAFEVTSDSTRDEEAEKLAVYRDVWRVRELFVFDPYRDYLRPPLTGYRLSRGAYRRIKPRGDRLKSTELGITLEVMEKNLVIRDANTGHKLDRSGDVEAHQDGCYSCTHRRVASRNRQPQLAENRSDHPSAFH